MKISQKITGRFVICLIIIGGLFIGSAYAEPIVYPAKGQSQEQTEKDKFACYEWAKKQTGFDPMQAPQATSPPPPKQKTTARPARGAAGGALAGLAIGSLAGEAGKGAAVGAATGGVIGGVRRRGQKRQQQSAEQQLADQQASMHYRQREEYNRAYGACLEGKGYTVK